MLTEDEITTRAAYDLMAGHYDDAFPDLTAEAPADRALIERFRGQVPAPGWVLDVGCGTGRVAAHLRRAGLRTVGADISRGMLAKARQRHSGLPLVVGSLGALPFATACASGLVAWYSIIHTAPDELRRTFAELARVLEEGAPVLLAFQAGEGERLDREVALGEHVRRTNYRHRVDEVTELLLGQGVAVEEVVVRPPETAFETTPQAFLLGARRRRS